ncbi:phosphohistidine phosphatase [Intrasporangium oryzae NRRL B-24470]|uniref:Phosphohistidine phosphatase n=1 Tax=Intrasporangium oryzae NRRL B-24470 TaxID=1386089 RepID=W9G8N2_9MICO|nr:NUDIX hydrolase [Intrasporangium oryzae]EWT02531.1 phosphohistidine phosphatase [Intrasporangium oryzae NRRL B-24470]
MASLIPAAGTLPWRRRGGQLEVALVHRPKYDDWSWAKGKLDPGEAPCIAAVRETSEETGLDVRLGPPLPLSEYPVLDAVGAPATKQVHYWAATVTGGSGRLEHEIDEVVWADVPTANARLDYARDREQLLALVRAEREGDLDTWPLALVRHAKAQPRSRWTGDDRLRPLDAVGRAQAATVAKVLAAYGVTRVVSSTSTRCVTTVEPYAVRRGARLVTRASLSEEGFAEDSSGAPRQVEKLLRRGEPAALCSHGPVLPTLLDTLAERVPADHLRAEWLTEQLRTAADSALRKGEVLVCHLTGRGAEARVVHLERVDT